MEKDTIKEKVNKEVEELYNRGGEFLQALDKNDLTPLDYKKLTEQERKKADEKIAKTLGVSSEEMKKTYANQIAWAKNDLYDYHFDKLKAFKEGDFKKAEFLEIYYKTVKNINSATRTIEGENTKRLVWRTPYEK